MLVGVSPVDVVEADGNLRHDLEGPLPGLETFLIAHG
jgi:hypothetical protein